MFLKLLTFNISHSAASRSSTEARELGISDALGSITHAIKWPAEPIFRGLCAAGASGFVADRYDSQVANARVLLRLVMRSLQMQFHHRRWRRVLRQSARPPGSSRTERWWSAQINSIPLRASRGPPSSANAINMFAWPYDVMALSEIEHGRFLVRQRAQQPIGDGPDGPPIACMRISSASIIRLYFDPDRRV